MSNPRRLESLKYFLLGLMCLVCESSHSPPSVGKLKSVWSITSAVPHVFVCDSQFVTQKNLTFFSISNIFTKSIYRVAIHIFFLHLLDQISGGKMCIIIPQSYGGYIHQLKYFSREVAHLWFMALIVEHNSKRAMAVILSANLMMMMM
jgi:hypothetical protein